MVCRLQENMRVPLPCLPAMSLDAVWTFQKNERVNVNYEYAVDDDCDGKYTLPTELTPPAAEYHHGQNGNAEDAERSGKDVQHDGGAHGPSRDGRPKHENVTGERDVYRASGTSPRTSSKETTLLLYYRQDADGKYSNKPALYKNHDRCRCSLKGNVGDTVKNRDLEPFYKEHYKGYEFDEDAETSVRCSLKADANENVLKLYKAEALMTPR